MIPVSLDDVLQYKNHKVLERYQKDYPQNKLSAEEAFTELLKYFWLCHIHRYSRRAEPTLAALNFDCGMHYEMREIDDMWHTFILFTQDYTDFGMHYFNQYIHHVPVTNEDEVMPESEFLEDLSRYLSYIYDHLGEATVKTWFQESLQSA